MLPAEVDFDVCALQFLVDVSEIVLHMLIGQLDVVVLIFLPHDSLVPHRHAVLLARLRLVLAYDRCKNRVRVPVHDRSQIDIQVKCERQDLLFEVAVGDELVDLTQLELQGVLRNAKLCLLEADMVAEADGQMIEKPADHHSSHHVVDDVIEASCQAVEHCHS